MRIRILLPLALLVAMAVPATLYAQLPPYDDPYGPPTYNFKDMMINWGAGRDDRDKPGQTNPPAHPPFEGTGIPDVFECWSLMYAIQINPAVLSTNFGLTGTDVYNIMESNLLAMPAVYRRPFTYYMSTSQGGQDHVNAFVAQYGMGPWAVANNQLWSIFSANADPDGDGVTNRQEFENTVLQYGLPVAPEGTYYGNNGGAPSHNFWNEDQWDIAMDHELGTNIPTRGGYVENDVMSTYSAVMFDPGRVPEPSSLALILAAGMGLLHRRRPW